MKINFIKRTITISSEEATNIIANAGEFTSLYELLISEHSENCFGALKDKTRYTVHYWENHKQEHLTEIYRYDEKYGTKYKYVG